MFSFVVESGVEVGTDVVVGSDVVVGFGVVVDCWVFMVSFTFTESCVFVESGVFFESWGFGDIIFYLDVVVVFKNSDLSDKINSIFAFLFQSTNIKPWEFEESNIGKKIICVFGRYYFRIIRIVLHSNHISFIWEKAVCVLVVLSDILPPSPR